MKNSTLKTKHSKFKSTPVGEIPMDWECHKLREHSTVQGGIQKGRKEKPNSQVLRYLTVAHVSGDRISQKDARYINATESELEKLRLLPDDLLLIEGNGNPNYVGRAIRFTGEFKDCVYQNHLIRVRCNSTLNASYLLDFLASNRGRYEVSTEVVSSSGLHTISVGRVRSLRIPLPPLSEQRKIAEILGTWDRAIKTQQQLIDSLTRRKKALMQQLLTGKTRLPGFEEEWEEVKLADVGTFRKGSGITKKDLCPEGVAAIRYAELYTKHDVTVRQIYSYVSEETAAKSCTVNTGDILFATSGETLEEIGKCAAYLQTSPCVTGGDCIVFSPDSHDSHFLSAVLNTGDVKKAISRQGQGNAVVHIYLRDLRDILVPLPSPQEQTAIATILTTADNEITHHTQHLNTLRTQKRGLMQQLLTGKTRVSP